MLLTEGETWGKVLHDTYIRYSQKTAAQFLKSGLFYKQLIFLVVLSYVDKREINTYDLYTCCIFCSEAAVHEQSITIYTQRGKEARLIALSGLSSM